MKPGVHRAVVPQSTLETDFPLPLCSEDYVTQRGPRNGPVLRQAVRWKKAPLGWDAAGQSWWTEPSCHGGAEDAGCSPSPGSAWERWQRWQQLRSASEVDPLPPVYDQHLREVAFWDPTVPAAYPGPSTRWGAFLWQERPILGKEYVATRSQGSAVLGGRPAYVPLLSSCFPQSTRRDVCRWSLLQHQPSTAANTRHCLPAAARATQGGLGVGGRAVPQQHR